MQRVLQEIYKNYETEELVAIYQSTHKEDMLQEIIRRNNGLLHKWVWDYRNIPYHSEEDLLEEATIALWQAVEHFEIDREYNFSSCLKGYIKQRFNRLYNEATRKKRYTGQEPTSWEELEEINKEKSVEFELLSDLSVKEFINALEGKVQEIAVLLFYGYSKSDVAMIFDIKPASVTYHCKRLERLAIEYFSMGGSERLI